MGTLRDLQQSVPPFVVEIIRLCIWLVFLMAVFIPLERFAALRSIKVFRKGFAADLGYFFLSSIVPRMLLVLPLSAIAWMVHRLVPGGFYQAMGEIPAGVRFLLALVIEEVGFYWGHRWMHEIPVLWRFHAIHHSPEEVDWLVHTHAHPIDLVFTRLCGLIPMYLLGLAQPLTNQFDLVPVLVTLVGTVWGFFIMLICVGGWVTSNGWYPRRPFTTGIIPTTGRHSSTRITPPCCLGWTGASAHFTSRPENGLRGTE